MSNTLEERLKTHSTAFDGLLSLIPAKYYYDDATQDQWQAKKKSKKELQQNKRAKLDPDSKVEADDYVNSHVSAKDVQDNRAKTATRVSLPGSKLPPVQKSQEVAESNEIEESGSDASSEEEGSFINSGLLIFDDEGNEIDDNEAQTNKFEKKEVQVKAKESKKTLSPEEQKKKEENLLKLRERLSAKIGVLKEKRRAPGTKLPGAPKSREQILDERKIKEEIKKQERLKRKHEEVEEEEESDSDSEEEKEEENEVLYGNIVFNDGSRVTSDLKKLRNTAEKKKQKGPAQNDLKAHLLKLEQKKQKLAQMTPEEQEKAKSKDKWQKVMAQAEGVKMKDDEKLLKKALKRKEKQKLRSEIEWKDRKQVVKDTVAARSKRREENLKSRRDNKGKKSKKAPKLRKFTGVINKAANKKKRAGFEGSAKSKK